MKSIIIALDNQNGFSKDGKIPWNYPEDFRYFKEKTLNNVCVMGRKTFDDLCEIRKEKLSEGEELLPNRISLILSNREIAKVNGCLRIKDLDESLEFDNVFYIGGKVVFDYGLKVCDKVYLTRINENYDCDNYFSFYEMVEKFELISSQKSGKLDFQVWSKNEP